MSGYAPLAPVFGVELRSRSAKRVMTLKDLARGALAASILLIIGLLPGELSVR